MSRRFLLAASLRLLAAVALLVSAASFFYRPLTVVLRPWLAPIAAHLPTFDRQPPSPPPAPGFMVSVTSTPAGAAFSVDGTPRGTTPTVANVVCRQGQEVVLAVEARGLTRWQKTVRCREGGSLQVRARLEQP